jgi:hypothetical protein
MHFWEQQTVLEEAFTPTPTPPPHKKYAKKSFENAHGHRTVRALPTLQIKPVAKATETILKKLSVWYSVLSKISHLVI